MFGGFEGGGGGGGGGVVGEKRFIMIVTWFLSTLACGCSVKSIKLTMLLLKKPILPVPTQFFFMYICYA